MGGSGVFSVTVQESLWEQENTYFSHYYYYYYCFLHPRLCMAAMCGGWVMLGLFLVLLRALRLKHSARPQSSTRGCTPAGPAGPTGLIGLTGPAGRSLPQLCPAARSPFPPPPSHPTHTCRGNKPGMKGLYSQL